MHLIDLEDTDHGLELNQLFHLLYNYQLWDFLNVRNVFLCFLKSINQ